MTTPTTSVESAGIEVPTNRRRLIIVLIVCLIAAAAGWWFALRPADDKELPIPGEVVVLEPIQVNLLEQHYLKLRIALEGVSGAEEPDGSRALDAAIDLFSGQSVADLAKKDRRNDLKAKLEQRVKILYEGDVLNVYFTEFVTQ